MLSAPEAERLGLIDVLLPRADFATGWRETAKALADGPGVEMKRVTAPGVTPDESAAVFAKLWVADAHWTAVDQATARRK